VPNNHRVTQQHVHAAASVRRGRGSRRGLDRHLQARGGGRVACLVRGAAAACGGGPEGSFVALPRLRAALLLLACSARAACRGLPHFDGLCVWGRQRVAPQVPRQRQLLVHVRHAGRQAAACCRGAAEVVRGAQPLCAACAVAVHKHLHAR
jgi:hypothetical protein